MNYFKKYDNSSTTPSVPHGAVEILISRIQALRFLFLSSFGISFKILLLEASKISNFSHGRQKSKKSTNIFSKKNPCRGREGKCFGFIVFLKMAKISKPINTEKWASLYPLKESLKGTYIINYCLQDWGAKIYLSIWAQRKCLSFKKIKIYCFFAPNMATKPKGLLSPLSFLGLISFLSYLKC